MGQVKNRLIYFERGVILYVGVSPIKCGKYRKYATFLSFFNYLHVYSGIHSSTIEILLKFY